ncbi:MAG: hypothetical protein UV64_C0040G0002 [Parcubacteria group bacterium GW2011_GWC1_43_11b]|nr:MAG: hypothetical protein UV64_C0040G0002 [Parcubacteria group bacterium GW2011_GWC1_43_11b]
MALENFNGLVIEPEYRKKKILIIVTLVAVVVLLLGLYLWLNRRPPQLGITPEERAIMLRNLGTTTPLTDQERGTMLKNLSQPTKPMK